MEAIRKTFSVSDTERNITLSVPKSFGSKIDIIILPNFESEGGQRYFEIVGSDGTEYKMPNCTEKEFKTIGVHAFFDTNDDADVDWEDWFGLK